VVTTFRAPLSRPVDFFGFWSRTVEELARVAPATRLEAAGSRDGVRLQRLSFASLGGVTIRGYLLRSERQEPRPLVVHGHGYGGQVTPRWSWARAGCDVVGIDVRGWGRSSAAVPAPSPWGWVLTGCQSPERSVLRGAVCDYLRAVQVGRRLLGERRLGGRDQPVPGAPARAHGRGPDGGAALLRPGQLRRPGRLPDPGRVGMVDEVVPAGLGC
jgi:cephalosporin-C deacetylase